MIVQIKNVSLQRSRHKVSVELNIARESERETFLKRFNSQLLKLWDVSTLNFVEKDAWIITGPTRTKEIWWFMGPRRAARWLSSVIE